MVLSPARSRTESVELSDSPESSCEHNSTSSSPTPLPSRAYAPASDNTIKYTPVTGRISKAKKGIPVHTCDECIPPKTFSRAEHLRRHQLSHNPPELYCLVPGCGKVFHRKDLLDRHHQRHEQEDGPGTVPKSPTLTVRHNRSPLPKSAPKSQSKAKADDSRPRRPVRPAPSATPKSRRRNSNATTTKRRMKIAASQPRATKVETKTPTTDNAKNKKNTQDVAADQDSKDVLSALSPDNTTLIKKDIELSDETDISSWHTDSTLHTASENTLPSTIREQSVSRQSFDSGVILPEASQNFNNTLNNNQGNGFYMPRQMDSFISIIPTEDPLQFTGIPHDHAARGLPIPPPLGLLGDNTISLAALETQNAVFLPTSVSPMFLTMNTTPTIPGLQQSTRDSMPLYLSLYWEHLDQEYPILHRATFEIQGLLNPEIFETLKCAMAALGAQFLGTPEHGIKGSHLHVYTMQKLQVLTKADHWPLQLKQAVACTEYYSRFLGREKDAYLGTQMFQTLYQTVAESASLVPKDTHHSWLSWVDEESRRRLLSACFVLDCHAARYFEQTPSAIRGMDYSQPTTMPIYLTSDSCVPWVAPTEKQWEEVYQGDMHTRTAGEVLESGLETSHVLSAAFLDLCSLLLTQSIKLIPRASQTRVDIVPDCSKIDIDNVEKPTLYTHTPSAYVYMALYYTPLHVVLSVTGDSWVFNKKVLRASAFTQHQKQLAMWRDSPNSAVAVTFATRALRGFLDIDPDQMRSKFKVAVHRDISDFWGIYVCALMCWVFGRTVSNSEHYVRPTREATLQWLREASELTPKEMEYLDGRNNAQGVIGLAKEALELRCTSNTCILITDALGVLRKLDEGGGVRF